MPHEGPAKQLTQRHVYKSQFFKKVKKVKFLKLEIKKRKIKKEKKLFRREAAEFHPRVAVAGHTDRYWTFAGGSGAVSLRAAQPVQR